MRRTKRREFVMTEAEARDLKNKAKAACMTESQLIRLLISGYKPPEAPGRMFFDCMNKLSDQAETMLAIARRECSEDTQELLFDESKKMKALRTDLIRKFLNGEEDDSLWLLQKSGE